MTAASSRLHVEARPAWSAAVCGLLGVFLAIAVGFIGSAAVASATLLDPGSGDDPYVGWVEQGDIGTYRYDYRPDFARPPPVEAENRGYDALLNSADPAGSLGRVLRAVSGPGEGFVAPSSSRGLSNLGGVIEETGTNAAGGRIFTSTGSINQNDFAGIINAGVTRGDDVHIFTGAHGFADGTIRADAGLRAADVARFGDIPGVHIHDFATMSPAQIRQILNGPGTIIGGFCDSGACLAPYRGG